MNFKLTFVTGTMGSAKTLNLLALRHEYMSKPGSGYKVNLVVPYLDDRYGRGIVKSRAGVEAKADALLLPDQRIQEVVKYQEFDLGLLLIDEAQFLSKKNVESLRELADDTNFDVSIRCYGLRTDYLTNLFEGSKRLLELADSIEMCYSICTYDESPAAFNLRKGNLEGGQIVLGDEDSYAEVCSQCYSAEMDGYGENKAAD